MIKITAFIFNLSKGGAQGVFVTVMNAFCNVGYLVDVVVQNLDDDIYRNELDQDINVESLNVSTAKDALPKLVSYVKNHQIECAWVFGPEMAVNLYLAKRINHREFPIIGRSINTLSTEFKYTDSIFRKYVTHTILKLFFHKIDYVIAQSKNMGEDLINNYSFKRNRVKVINNSLARKFEQELDNTEMIERDKSFLYVGRLEKQKGLDMLINAFAQIKDDNAKLMILGDGGEKDALVNMVDQLGLQERVEFLGYSTKTEEYYRKASAVVLSSYFEGFPNVLIEATACGTPVVSFDCPSGPDEIIIEETNGYLVEYCNVEKLTHAMNKALLHKWDYIEVKNTAKRYTSSKIFTQYVSLLEECMDCLEK